MDSCEMCGKDLSKKDLYMHKIVRVFDYEEDSGAYLSEETESEQCFCAGCSEGIEQDIREEVRLGLKERGL
jgi:hypothetical protein